MNSLQTFNSYDGRMILKEGRDGGYVRLADYETLEKEITTLRESVAQLRRDMIPDECKTRD